MEGKRFSTVLIKVVASGLKAERDLLWLEKLEELPWEWLRRQWLRLCFQCKGRGFDPSSGNWNPMCCCGPTPPKEKLESRLQRKEIFLEVHHAQIPAKGRNPILPLRTFEINGELNPSKAQLHLSYRLIWLNSPHDLKGKESFPLLGVLFNLVSYTQMSGIQFLKLCKIQWSMKMCSIVKRGNSQKK